MRVLILAAGSQTRWNETGGKGLKQLIEVDGEALVQRTFRLASERTDGDVFTVVRDPRDPAWKGLKPKAAKHEDWMGEMGKFLDHQHLWDGHDIVVLWGDAYYTEATLDAIFQHEPSRVTIYGRAKTDDPAGKRRPESFGMRWSPTDYDEIVRVAKECADVGLNSKGGPWRWFLRKHTCSDTYDINMVRPLAKEHNGWVEVGHDETDDFDDHHQWREWQRRWGKG